MANLDGLVVSLRSSRAHWRRCLGPQRCTAREGASGSAEIRGDRWVPSDREVRTLLLRSLHFDLLKEEPEHPRVVHPGRSTPVSLETFCEVKSVSRTGLAKLSRSKAGLARSSGVIRKITSTVNLVPKGGEVNG